MMAFIQASATARDGYSSGGAHHCAVQMNDSRCVNTSVAYHDQCTASKQRIRCTGRVQMLYIALVCCVVRHNPNIQPRNAERRGGVRRLKVRNRKRRCPKTQRGQTLMPAPAALPDGGIAAFHYRGSGLPDMIIDRKNSAATTNTMIKKPTTNGVMANLLPHKRSVRERMLCLKSYSSPF